MSGEEEDLVAVDTIDSQIIWNLIEKKRPDFKPFKYLWIYAIESFKKEFENKRFPRSEIFLNLEKHITPIINREVDSRLMQLVIEGKVEVRMKNGKKEFRAIKPSKKKWHRF